MRAAEARAAEREKIFEVIAACERLTLVSKARVEAVGEKQRLWKSDPAGRRRRGARASNLTLSDRRAMDRLVALVQAPDAPEAVRRHFAVHGPTYYEAARCAALMTKETPMKALIIVDVQNDFLPGGALAVPNGEWVVPEIVRLMKMGDYDVIVATADAHPPETKHFEKWPVHCVKGTQGAQLEPQVLAALMQTAVGQTPLYFVTKGDSTEDDGYSGFEGVTAEGRALEDVLADHSVSEVHVVGLATDYCVKATALDAARRFDKTTVLLGATRPVDPETGRLAEIAMFEAGVDLVRACWNCHGSGIGCCEYAAARVPA